MKKNQYFFASLFLLFSLNFYAQSTYYVSLSGDDANDGLSEATAWRTIGFSASSASPVSGGDTVYIKAGDYGLDDVFVDKNYSPSDERISFIGYQNAPGDITEMNFDYGDNVDPTFMPLINPNDRTQGEGINLSDIYNITFKNIQIANSIGGINIWNTVAINTNHIFENIFIQTIGDSYSTAFGMKEADGNTITNCLIINATGAGMDLWGTNNLIEDCKVYSDENELTDEGTYTSMDYYIVLKGDNNIVRNCYIERVGDIEDVGHGMEIKESGEGNLFVDCISKNMIGGCYSVRWSLVQNNEFRNCKAIGTLPDVCAFLVRDGASNNTFNNCISEGCPAGVRYLLSLEDADYCGDNNVFNNCIIKGARWAFDLNEWYYSSAPVDNNKFYNCVIDNADNLFNCQRPNSGNELVNCIVTRVDTFLTGDDPSNFIYSYCNFYNNGFDMPSGTGNIDQDPEFINIDDADYHLQSTSPCVDAGTSTDAPAEDYEGTSRPQGSGYDIGAYEYTLGSSIGEAENQTLLVYPNPVKEKIMVNLPLSGNHFQITNLTGKIVKQGTINQGEIEVKELRTGVYFISFLDHNELISMPVKFVVE